MYLKELEISGFKSFAKKTNFSFSSPVTAIVGPNGSGKSNVAEALRWVLGEQSMKSLRGKRGEDLIWNGSGKVPRSGRASVTITFDNLGKQFNLDFPEVYVTREVHRDGVNDYKINDSQVRLKDVYELLSQVSLGASSHHIISQGEADRLLLASLKDRKEMIEDALGLKIYQYKKTESERKLEKTEENIKEAELIRRELAPHLKFLERQVKQYEKAEEMRMELRSLYREYFELESAELKKLHFGLEGKHGALNKDLEKINAEINQAEKSRSQTSGVGSAASVREIETTLSRLREEKTSLARELGKLEGMLGEANRLGESFLIKDESGVDRCRFCGQRLGVDKEAHQSEMEREKKLRELSEQKEILEKKIESFDQEISTLEKKVLEERRGIEEAGEKSRVAERILYELRAKKNEIVAQLNRLNLEKESFVVREIDFKRESAEAIAFVGEIKHLGSGGTSGVDLGREELRRRIERLKIKLEEVPGGGREIVREYEETRVRDEHLAREVEDLEESKKSLEELMKDLEKTLEERFHEGIENINREFKKFFGVLFGGGEALLKVVKIEKRRREIDELVGEFSEKTGLPASISAEAEIEAGVEISVNLPRKKIKSLEMLSGGERALTSIALLFAMTGVNPPPFLVLDETDAALDEANSKKYGEMIELLAQKSQLILITHNRETMAHAEVLYGVTMGFDGASQLLSVKFDQAENYAK